MDISERNFEGEFIFTASRSGGPGGQNVNKVSSKIELRFNIMESMVLTPEEKETIISLNRNKISKEGILVIQAQVSRSQLKNKKKSIEKFYCILAKALTPIKKRKRTKPSLSSKKKRLDKKKVVSTKKMSRKKIGLDD